MARAGQVYGLLTSPTAIDGTSRLTTFDSATPQNLNIIGSTGLTDFASGLDFDSSGNLYLTTAASSGFLYAINSETGAAAQIGGSGLAANYQIGDLSWDPVGNRMLAIAFRAEVGLSPILYQVDLGSGVLTSLGSINGITDGFEVTLAVNAQGAIFVQGVATDRFYSVDRDTLAATALNALPFAANFGQGATVDWSGSDTLYYAAFNGSAFTGQFYTVDQINGDVSFVNTIGTNIGDVVQLSDIAIRPVPEPSSIALTVIGMAGLALAARRARRRP